MQPSNVAQLVDVLAQRPHIRTSYTDAARFFEKQGDAESAQSFYNGVVPAWIVKDYRLDDFAKGSVKSSRGWERALFLPETVETLTPVINPDPKRNSVFDGTQKRCPEEYLDVVKGARILSCGKNKAVLDSDNVRMLEHSDANSYLLQQMRERDDTKVRRLKGYSV